MGRLGLADLGGWGGWMCGRKMPVSQGCETWDQVHWEAGWGWVLNKGFINNSQNTRWFKVTFWFPTWRSLSPLKGSLNHPKKVTKNCPAWSGTNKKDRNWMTTKGGPNLIHPRCYMYALLACIWLELMVHVAKYSIHGAYGRGYQPLMAPWVSTFDRGHGTEKKKPRRLDLLKIQKQITRRCFFFRERSQSLPPGVSSVNGVNGSSTLVLHAARDRPLCSASSNHDGYAKCTGEAWEGPGDLAWYLS